MHSFTVLAPQIIAEKFGKNHQNHFLIFDGMSEAADYFDKHRAPDRNKYAADFYGHMSSSQASKATREGDLKRVALSDSLLNKMEQHELPSSRKAWRDDVCGSIPNVPAFIAGHPMAMRRRVRDDGAAAPLAIVADLSSSAMISAEQIAKRGAVLLALTRALSARRPVELWLSTAGGKNDGTDCVTTLTRIETAPLDLARAAFAMTHAAFARHICYGNAGSNFPTESGRWPYGKGALSREQMEAVCAPAFLHVAQTLCIPGIYATDPMLSDPEAWLASQLAEHGAQLIWTTPPSRRPQIGPAHARPIHWTPIPTPKQEPTACAPSL